NMNEKEFENLDLTKLTYEEFEQLLSPEQREALEAFGDDLLAQVVKSMAIQSEDPLLDSYFNNPGFRVTAGDANALAGALERALPDVPGHDAMAHKVVELEGAPGERFLRNDTPVIPFELFSGPNKVYLKSFIEFCRQGEFNIW